MTIYLDFNGQPTDASDLTWYVLAECGCATGAIAAAAGGHPIALTADQARREMNDTKREAAKDKREYVLGHRTEVKERMAPCTHGSCGQ